MVTNTELSFRTWFKPKGVLVKYPDFKQTGGSSGRGMPDYMYVHGGRVCFIEVKSSTSVARFAFTLVERSQWEVLHKLYTKGGMDTWFAAYMGNKKKDLWFFRFSRLAELYATAPPEQKSVSLEELRAISSSESKHDSEYFAGVFLAGVHEDSSYLVVSRTKSLLK